MPVAGPQLPGQGKTSNRLRNTQNNQQSKTRKPIKPNADLAALPPLDPASTANYYSQIQGLYSQYRNTLDALKQQRVGLRSGGREMRAGIRREEILGIASAENEAINQGMLGSSQDAEEQISIRANAAQQIAQVNNEVRSGLQDTRIQAQQAATDYFMGVSGIESAALAQQQSQLADDLLNNLIASGQEQNADLLAAVYDSLSGKGGGKVFPDVKGAGPIGNRLLDFARSQQGTVYDFGTINPIGKAGGPGASFDCSGFTSWAVSQATGGKLQLPHSAAAQSDVLPKLSKNELRPGDLLFFNYGSGRYGRNIDHVAIYMGNGQMIDTSSTDRPLGIRAVDWDNFVQGGRTPHGKKKPGKAGAASGLGLAGGQQ